MRTTCQDDIFAREVGDTKGLKPLVIRKLGKRGLDDLLSVDKVTILVGLHRVAKFEHE